MSIFGITALIGVILSFQNIATSAPVGILFNTTNKVLFFPLMLMFLLGLVGGVFLGFYFLAGRKKSDFDDGGL